MAKNECFENVISTENTDLDEHVDQSHSGSHSDVEFAELFEKVPILKNIFLMKSKIGEGTFSNVYQAHLVEHPDELFALKHIIPTSSPDRVEREIRCLQEMGGKNNVIGYKGAVRHYDHTVIMLPYFPHDRFQTYFLEMTTSDIKDYMKNLFIALKHIHSFDIIHRDIKPGNFLHSRQSGRYNLVDFGLAMHESQSKKSWEIEKKNDKYNPCPTDKTTGPSSQKRAKRNGQPTKKQRTSPRFMKISHKLNLRSHVFVPKTKVKCTKLKDITFVASNKHAKSNVNHETMKISHKLPVGLCQTKHKSNEICSLCSKRAVQSAPRAGTSGFRAPEVLLKHPEQTTAVDVWSAGVILLCLLTGKYPFFRCADDMTALAQIMTVFGKQRVVESAKFLGKYMVSNSTCPGYELKELAQRLRASNMEEERPMNCCESCKAGSTEEQAFTSITDKANIDGLDEDEKFCVTLNSCRYSNDVNDHVTGRRKLYVKMNEKKRACIQSKCINDSDSRVGVPNDKDEHRIMSESGRSFSKETTKREEGKLSVKEHLDGSPCLCVCGLCKNYVPLTVYDLLERCLDLNPTTRITASEALSHPFIRENINSLECAKL